MSCELTSAEMTELASKNLSIDAFYAKYTVPFTKGKLKEDKYLLLEKYFLENNTNRRDIKNLRKRLDKRNLAEFAKTVKQHTDKETFLVNLFAAEMKLLGHTVEVKDHGVDNEGGFLGVPKNTGRSDFLIDIGGSGFRPYEIKNSPVPHKCTFKIANLESYLLNKSYMILFYGTGRIEKDFDSICRINTRWAILTPDIIARMFSDFEHKFYFEVGNKLAIQILEHDYDKYFQSRKLQTL